MTQKRIGDVVSQGDLIGNVRESMRQNIALYLQGATHPWDRPAHLEEIAALAELLARQAVQTIIMTPIGETVPDAEVLPSDAEYLADAMTSVVYALEGFTGSDQVRICRAALLLAEPQAERAEVERIVSLGRPPYAIASELAARELADRQERIGRCPGCEQPVHASESDDHGRCADCVRAAGETPLTPNQE